jgi:hypothetical protein
MPFYQDAFQESQSGLQSTVDGDWQWEVDFDINHG